MIRGALFIVAVVVAGAPAAAQQAATPAIKAPLHACDTLAGNPIDPGRVGRGVATASLRAEAAIIACQEAVRLFPNELRFQFQLGRAFRQANRLEDALRWYTAAADKGYAGALNSLGVMYSQGEGVIADCNKAAHYFGLAANQGYPAANDNLRTLSCVRQV
jgi:TPR repeat protein